jgi:uncharacterized protein
MRQRLLLILIALSLALGSSCRKPTATNNSAPAATPSVATSPVVSEFPKQKGLINDFADVLDADERDHIQPVLDGLLRDLDVEFAVVTVDTTGTQSAFDYSLAMSREWKVGKSGKGLLYLLAVKDKQWRIQVSKSLEQALPNDLCAELHKPSLKLLKEEKYGEAVESYVRALDEQLRKKK